MSVKWVEDIDSGELLPVVDDNFFDVPEHLKIADYNEVDYDKTRDFTVAQLQEQLISAQNYIKEIQRDSTADTASKISAPPVEITEKKQFHSIEKVRFSWYFFISVVVISVLIASIFGFKYFSDKVSIETDVNNLSVSSSSADNKASAFDEDTSEETENTSTFSSALSLCKSAFPVLLSVSGVRFGIGLLRKTIGGD